MNSKILIPILALLSLALPVGASQVGLYSPRGFCGGIIMQPLCIGLPLPVCPTVGRCASVMMVSTCQIIGGSGLCTGIQTHSLISCQLGGPSGAGPQGSCLMSLTVNGRQIVLHIP